MIDLKNIKRGEVLNVILNGSQGSEQGGERPVVVIQNNIGNTYSPTIIVACITSQLTKAKLPTHVELDKDKYGLKYDSIVLCEQLRTLDKRTRIKERITMLDEFTINKIDKALRISLDLEDKEKNRIKQNENPLNKLDFHEKEKIETILKDIYDYENIIEKSHNEGLIRHLRNERDSLLYRFRRVCKNNNLDHQKVYENVKFETIMALTI